MPARRVYAVEARIRTSRGRCPAKWIGLWRSPVDLGQIRTRRHGGNCGRAKLKHRFMVEDPASKAVLGLIPAKGGSTRFPLKNIERLGGKTLIEWAASAAIESGVIGRLVLSTEDERVAAAAQAVGIDVPFIRPQDLARDPTGVAEVALHALDSLEMKNERYDTLIILLPTCPFRTAEDIRSALRLFHESYRTTVMSVSEFSHTPFAAMCMDSGRRLTPAFPDFFGRKSQEMPRAYRPNGAVHVLDVNRLRQTRSYTDPPILGYVMPRNRSFDIDTAEDLREAEAWLRSLSRA